MKKDEQYRTHSQNPKVSVIIPAYNASAYILSAIQSVEMQDYHPLEIIVIDDGSQDETASLIRIEKPNVRLIQQNNLGVAAARNTGLKEANGEFICFLDADDGWFSGKVKAQVNYLTNHPDVGLSYHHWLVWQPDTNTAHCLPSEPSIRLNSSKIDLNNSGWIYPQLLLNCVVHTSTVMLRHKIAQQIGEFDVTLPNGEDYDYWLRVSRYCKIDQLSEVYSFYRMTPNSLTSYLKPLNYEYLVLERALNNWGLVSPDGSQINEKKIAKRLSTLAMSFGYLHFHSKTGSAEIAWQSFLKAIKHNPLNLKAILYLIAARIKAELC